MRSSHIDDVYETDEDLEKQIVADEIGLTATFQVSPFQKYCLMEGLDDIGLTLRHEDAITAYEVKRRAL